MLANKRTKHSFMRYCLDDKEISKELGDKVEAYKANKRTENNPSINFNKEKSLKRNKIQPESVNRNHDLTESGLLETSTRHNIDSVTEKLSKLEDVHKHPDYKGKVATQLGINKKKNIALRHKEGRFIHRKKSNSFNSVLLRLIDSLIIH